MRNRLCTSLHTSLGKHIACIISGYNFIAQFCSLTRFAEKISQGYCSAAQRPVACEDGFSPCLYCDSNVTGPSGAVSSQERLLYQHYPVVTSLSVKPLEMYSLGPDAGPWLCHFFPARGLWKSWQDASELRVTSWTMTLYVWTLPPQNQMAAIVNTPYPSCSDLHNL